MAVDRLLPDEDARELVDLVAAFSRAELQPVAAAAEKAEEFPREMFRRLGGLGLLGMPYPDEFGGMDQPYEVYLQALEEVSAAWLSVGVGVSVHIMTCFPLLKFGTPQQRERFAGDLIGGRLLGAYALSEAQAGSDITSMTTTAKADGDDYLLTGAKAWITHASHADYYTTFARTGPGLRDLSCFLVPADAEGLSFGAPEQKMGLTASTTAAVYFDGVRVAADRRIGEEGQGMRIALSALDNGRLGIAACATGLAQAALDNAVAYAKERQQFGQRIADFQGLQFLLADMEAAVATARATYLDAARRRDAGQDFTRAAAVAKLVATDAAMKVTTDAVQVLGGYGYTKEFPLERFMREAKVTQIFEGTNQIQRMVIARRLLG
ncbi:acyl-CoA dehydrogenase family protein [Enemella evansiae]|uniref:acyl-CoA dehydrogenase family protein n=1 Tax=Enemella evansiae TaxID=2016499 RepID=UPI0010619879|nr:acyl-CoA dehydrogenase family protein [Enemella evansiae]TDO85946.1 alkylation response protein AidB-like acyl-CoA dehydrogenase [Enemella evansiae]